jgi:hypothetical protein
MIKHLSKHSHYQTHFNRTDPWPMASFDDDADESTLVKVIASAGLIVTLVLLVIL